MRQRGAAAEEGQHRDEAGLERSHECGQGQAKGGTLGDGAEEVVVVEGDPAPVRAPVAGGGEEEDEGEDAPDAMRGRKATRVG